MTHTRQDTAELQHALRAVVGASRTLARLGYHPLADQLLHEVSGYMHKRPWPTRPLSTAMQRPRNAIESLDQLQEAALEQEVSS